MAQYAVTGAPAKPMPARISAWAIYDVFDTKDGEQIFVGVVSDTQWQKFCADFGLDDLARDSGLATNAERVKRRDDILPIVRKVFKRFSKVDLMAKLERSGLPFAPITKPEELFDDPHLAAGGLLEVRIPNDGKTHLPALPLALGGKRFGVRHDLPPAGAHGREILREAGYSAAEIAELAARKVIA